MSVRLSVLRLLLDRIDEQNFHVCGGNWRWLSDLVDRDADGIYGDLADWVAAIACEWVSLPTDDDHIETLRPHLPDFAAQFLGLTQPQWAAIEHLPLQRTREVLRHLLDTERRRIRREEAQPRLLEAASKASRIRKRLTERLQWEEPGKRARAIERLKSAERRFSRLFNLAMGAE